ncbi:hypothetical protein ROJ8625_02662 [Roseivivax jejudonensis]|uniref:Sulfotransferase family protein n=1 Tax=Roseivivax jejudonensis TaxID=1529041 RepID=A0A1X6ZJA5_9RHOB|nr:hypothetical protein [Roseivivax jejudonensis]SLN52683.1 hypothetical protein ROJ8625_02662 [Roseivivax jejudonensis]
MPKSPPVDHPVMLEPRPLIFADRPLVVAWTPKSACSTVLMWYLHLEGLLNAAAFYDPWPHQFRTRVYYSSATWKHRANAVADAGGTGFSLLRVTRDPVKRLVSTFRHSLRNPQFLRMLSDGLGRDCAETGHSLRDLAEVLMRHTLTVPTDVNVHAIAQTLPLMDMGFDRRLTLNIDTHDMEAGLNAVAAAFDLPATQFADIAYLQEVTGRHHARDTPYSGDIPVDERRFCAADAAAWPKSALERSAAARDIARALYATDMANVSTDDSAGQIAFAPR